MSAAIPRRPTEICTLPPPHPPPPPPPPPPHHPPSPLPYRMLAIPVTHCTLSANGSGIRNCFSNDGTNEGIACVAANDSGPLQIQFRNTVYLGQFRFICESYLCQCWWPVYVCAAVDALFAVYEASSWELWSFMEYAAVNGGSRTPLTSPAFYLTLVLFLVVFVQVCSRPGWLVCGSTSPSLPPSLPLTHSKASSWL